MFVCCVCACACHCARLSRSPFHARRPDGRAHACLDGVHKERQVLEEQEQAPRDERALAQNHRELRGGGGGGR
eukprot:3739265-Pleurochrysis_carterae.AAC.1